MIHKENKNLNYFETYTSEKTSEISTVLENWHHESAVNNIDLVEEINNHLNSIRELYIADGHHKILLLLQKYL